jgi:hypothetical protein
MYDGESAQGDVVIWRISGVDGPCKGYTDLCPEDGSEVRWRWGLLKRLHEVLDMGLLDWKCAPGFPYGDSVLPLDTKLMGCLFVFLGHKALISSRIIGL